MLFPIIIKRVVVSNYILVVVNLIEHTLQIAILIAGRIKLKIAETMFIQA